jgi:hypothetical protein
VFFSFVCLYGQQQQLTNIPSMYITTTNGQNINSKTTWVAGSVKIISSDATENLNVPMTIRGRGNSTWNLQKKPYRIKLDEKAHLLNLPDKAKDWVLLANHADKTLIRNAVAFKISELLGFEFSPAARFVDLYVNNQYQGNYMVTDQMERGDHRVQIEKLDSTMQNMPDLSGGYLVEIDGFADGEPAWFTTTQALKVTVKYPDWDTAAEKNRDIVQFNYIQSFINSFESVLFSADFKNATTGYRSMVDTTSLINWYIASELTGNPDCFWSTYMYKKRGIDKLFFGPLWDFDIAFNNCNRIGEATTKLMRENAFNPRTWIARFWQDEWFKTATNRRWKELTQDGTFLNQLQNYIDSTVTVINASQQKNYEKWKVLNTRVYNEQQLFSTYAGGVNFLKDYLTQRVAFLTTSFQSTDPTGTVTPPTPEPPTLQAFVTESFYYRILNEGSNNAIDVENESDEASSKLHLWAPISEDISQEWRIDSLGNGAFMIVNHFSGLAMTGNGKGANLIQNFVDSTDASQQWQIVPVVTNGLYGLVNVKSGYSANNSGGGVASGTPVIEYDNNITLTEKKNQHWYIEKVTKIETDTVPMSISSVVQDYNAFPIRIYNIYGMLISTADPQNKAATLRNLPAGIYILKQGGQSSKWIAR